jgi:hypothetical protein
MGEIGVFLYSEDRTDLIDQSGALWGDGYRAGRCTWSTAEPLSIKRQTRRSACETDCKSPRSFEHADVLRRLAAALKTYTLGPLNECPCTSGWKKREIGRLRLFGNFPPPQNVFIRG